MKKQGKAFVFRGKYFFLFMLIVYGILFFVDSQSALFSLRKSGAVLLKVLPIFVAVILLTALLNYFLQPRQIARYLGRESGVQGWLWALAAGIISHGPMYAWYPLLEDLRSHGMRDGLIVVFFSARTIKIPLLPLMIDYFGWSFTLVVSLYILVGSLVQGWLLEFIERPRNTG